MRALYVLGVLCALVAGLTARASAEPYVAGSSGVAFPLELQKVSPLKASVTGKNLHNTGYDDFDLDPSVHVGGKVGFWLDAWPTIGFEANVNLYFPDISPQTVRRFAEFNRQDNTGKPPVEERIQANIDVVSVGLVALGRLPLGPVVPYGGGGVALQHVDVKEFTVNGVAVRGAGDDDTVPSVQLQGGVKVYISPNIGLFVEYVYTNGDIDLIIGNTPFDPNSNDTIEVDFDSQFIHGGIEYRFWDPFAQ